MMINTFVMWPKHIKIVTFLMKALAVVRQQPITLNAGHSGAQNRKIIVNRQSHDTNNIK